ncbi:hypothetical protein BDV19DRAFT_310624 [Aspergillus venezuelensis]
MSSRYRYVWPKDPLPGNPQHWPRGQRFADVCTGKGPDIYVEKRSPKTTKPQVVYTKTEKPQTARPKIVHATAIAGHGCDGSYSYAYTDSCTYYHNHTLSHDRYYDHRHSHHHDNRPIRGQRQEVPPTVIINREPRCKSWDRSRGQTANERTGGRDWSRWGREHLENCRRRYCDECDRIRGQERRDNVFSPRHPDERYDFRTRTYQIPDEGTWSRKVYCDDAEHIVPSRYWDRYGREYPSGMWHDRIHGVHAERVKPKVYYR